MPQHRQGMDRLESLQIRRGKDVSRRPLLDRNPDAVETGLNNDQNFGDTTGENQGTVFGNMSLTLKVPGLSNNASPSSVGTIVDLPTAPNGTITDGIDPLTFRNDSVHALPFLGFAYAPAAAISSRPASFNSISTPTAIPLTRRFVGSDPRLVHFAIRACCISICRWAIGCFATNRCCGCRYLTGIAPVVELHYTTTLQSYPAIPGDLPVFGGTDCWI